MYRQIHGLRVVRTGVGKLLQPLRHVTATVTAQSPGPRLIYS